MSMLSAQCDKLRETAELVEGHGKVGFGDLIITDPLMVDAAKEMRDAADTIWSLRCGCVELQGQMDDAKHDLSVFSERIVALADENAKLRELVRDYAKAANYLCERYDECSWNSCATCALDDCLRKCVLIRLGDKAKKLGIEVTT